MKHIRPEKETQQQQQQHIVEQQTILRKTQTITHIQRGKTKTKKTN